MLTETLSINSNADIDSWAVFEHSTRHLLLLFLARSDWDWINASFLNFEVINLKYKKTLDFWRFKDSYQPKNWLYKAARDMKLDQLWFFALVIRLVKISYERAR